MLDLARHGFPSLVLAHLAVVICHKSEVALELFDGLVRKPSNLKYMNFIVVDIWLKLRRDMGKALLERAGGLSSDVRSQNAAPT